MPMPLDAAILTAQEMPTRWCLMARTLHEGRWYPIYACGNCFGQRYTIVTSVANLPAACPQCKKPMGPPSPHLKEELGKVRQG